MAKLPKQPLYTSDERAVHVLPNFEATMVDAASAAIKRARSRAHRVKVEAVQGGGGLRRGLGHPHAPVSGLELAHDAAGGVRLTRVVACIHSSATIETCLAASRT